MDRRFAPEYKAVMTTEKPETAIVHSEVTAPAPVALAAGPLLAVDEFAAILKPGQRLIGIDIGTKTLGLALSDVERRIASGFETIRRKKFTPDAAYLLEIAAKHKIGGFVLGLPLNMDGSEGPRAQGTRAFQRNLAKLTPLPMLFWDERLSTAAAERLLIEGDASRKRRAEVIDQMAAAIILQTALDRMRRLAATP